MKVYELIAILMELPAGALIAVCQNNPNSGDNPVAGDVSYVETGMAAEDEGGIVQLYFNKEE